MRGCVLSPEVCAQFVFYAIMCSMKNVIIILLAILIPVGMYLLLKPTKVELDIGWDPPQIVYDMDGLLRASELSPENFANERTKSFAWISLPLIREFEKTIHKVTIPPLSLSIWATERVVDHKLSKFRGFFVKGIISLLVLFAMGASIIVYGCIITVPQRRFARARQGEEAFIASIFMGFFFGLGVLMQLVFSWFFIPFLLYVAGVVATLIGLLNLCHDIVKVKFWALFTVVALPLGYLAGIFLAVFLEFLLMFFVAGIVLGIAFFVVTRCLPDFAYSTGKKGKLSDGTVVEKMTDGTWQDGAGNRWSPDGFGKVKLTHKG